VSVDDQDNDPKDLLAYVAEALDAVERVGSNWAPRALDATHAATVTGNRAERPPGRTSRHTLLGP